MASDKTAPLAGYVFRAKTPRCQEQEPGQANSRIKRQIVQREQKKEQSGQNMLRGVARNCSSGSVLKILEKLLAPRQKFSKIFIPCLAINDKTSGILAHKGSLTSLEHIIDDYSKPSE